MAKDSTQTITFRLTKLDLAALDALVTSGAYPTRTAVLRFGLHMVVEQARDTAIIAEHRAAYSAMPDDSSVGDLGLAAGAHVLDREAIEHRDAS